MHLTTAVSFFPSLCIFNSGGGDHSNLRLNVTHCTVLYTECNRYSTHATHDRREPPAILTRVPLLSPLLGIIKKIPSPTLHQGWLDMVNITILVKVSNAGLMN